MNQVTAQLLPRQGSVIYLMNNVISVILPLKSVIPECFYRDPVFSRS